MSVPHAVAIALGIFTIVLCAQTAGAEVPSWVNFPRGQWETITPEKAGLDVQKFNAWLSGKRVQIPKGFGGQKPADGAVMLTRGGYVIKTWGDTEYSWQNKSNGKPHSTMLLYIAIHKLGLIKSINAKVKDYWTGVGHLNSPHKLMTNGHNANVTFKHLIDMRGGFPLSNGYFWRNKRNVPPWAAWTGNPDYDNYAHVKPGTQNRYSSGGRWRLSQVLTAIYNKSQKDALDEHVMSKIGISPGEWDWQSGEYVRSNKEFYPAFPGYGGFCDPPYQINGHEVVGGGGWVVISAQASSRLALLKATGGYWDVDADGKIDPDTELVCPNMDAVDFNRGLGQSSGFAQAGWGKVDGKDGYFTFVRLAANLLDPTGRPADPTPSKLASWITGAPNVERISPRVPTTRSLNEKRDRIKLGTGRWPGASSPDLTK